MFLTQSCLLVQPLSIMAWPLVLGTCNLRGNRYREQAVKSFLRKGNNRREI